MWQDQTVGGDLATFLQVGPGFGIWIAYLVCTLALTPVMAFWSAIVLLVIVVVGSILFTSCLRSAGTVAKGQVQMYGGRQVEIRNGRVFDVQTGRVIDTHGMPLV
jgi:hypothetical protein